MLVGNNSEMCIPNSMNTLASLILHDHRGPLASGSFGETLLAFTEHQTVCSTYPKLRAVIGMVNMLGGITMDRSASESNNLRSHVVLRCVATTHAFGNDCARASQDSLGIRSGR